MPILKIALTQKKHKQRMFLHDLYEGYVQKVYRKKGAEKSCIVFSLHLPPAWKERGSCSLGRFCKKVNVIRNPIFNAQKIF